LSSFALRSSSPPLVVEAPLNEKTLHEPAGESELERVPGHVRIGKGVVGDVELEGSILRDTGDAEGSAGERVGGTAENDIAARDTSFSQRDFLSAVPHSEEVLEVLMNVGHAY
jgi:hypothetical protein